MKNHQSNWLLYIIWIIALVAAIALNVGNESTNFQGIAETREIMISSEIPVEIKRINVVEGQSVARGQLILEMASPDMVIKINNISHRLEELRAQKGLNKDEIRSQIKQLKAQKISLTTENINEIRRIENQYNIVKELASGLKSTGYEETENSKINNPVFMKIESLKQETDLALKPLNIKLELLQKLLDNSENPLKIQIEQLEKELDLLNQENSKLNIYSQISGVIGSINFRQGENVSPFTSIMTLHTKNPSFIKGYINENAYTRVSVGKKVLIASQADLKNKYIGDIVGVGSRIVEYPVRLRKHPELQAWGREVIIKIPDDNLFILGEKVLITSTEPRTTMVSYFKNLIMPEEIHAENNKHFIPIVPLKTDAIEASAILRLSDTGLYLILSDDTPDKKPLMFLMDSNGKIVEETLIHGLDEINDMESVTQNDNGTIYIASSLSISKKGKLGKSRKLLISVKREKNVFTLINKCDLYELLQNSAKRNQNTDWAKFILKGTGENSIDIESMFYHDKALYLGFKTPFYYGYSVILKIDQIDDVFLNQNLDNNQIGIWKKVLLKENHESSQECISDLFYKNKTLFITGSDASGNKSGSLWKLDEATDELTVIEHFDNLVPEGIAQGKDSDTLIVCFDMGNKNQSRITTVRP